MEIYLVRHTTPHIEKGICYGQSDINLAINHKEEFDVVTSKIPNIENPSVISSPLKRCTKLAQTFSDTVVFDTRLKELDFGDWELKPWNDIPEKDMNPWMKDFVNVKVPNGESYTQLAHRINTFFEELLASKDDKTIIIISHAGPIRAFLASCLETPLKDSFSIKINYGDVFHLKKEKDTFKLITIVDA